MVTLGELAEVQMGYSFRSRLEHDPSGEVSVIQMKDIDSTNVVRVDQAIRVSLPEGKAHHLLRPGDLLFRSRGQSNGAAQVSDDIGEAVVAAPILRIRSRSVLPDYLCWFLNTPLAQQQLATVAAGTSVRMISAEALKDLEVPVPSAAVQRCIAEAATLADREQFLIARIATERHRLTTHYLIQHAQRSSRKAT
jgi:restriction endonuclease S subunit